jgi:hypothetical protein
MSVTIDEVWIGRNPLVYGLKHTSKGKMCIVFTVYSIYVTGIEKACKLFSFPFPLFHPSLLSFMLLLLPPICPFELTFAYVTPSSSLFSCLYFLFSCKFNLLICPFFSFVLSFLPFPLHFRRPLHRVTHHPTVQRTLNV